MSVLGHLTANTLPLIILGWLVMLRRTYDFVVVVLVSALVSGLGIWLFGGSRTIHLGASGVIFGLLGALLARAYFERSWAALGLAIIAGLSMAGCYGACCQVRRGSPGLAISLALLGGCWRRGFWPREIYKSRRRLVQPFANIMPGATAVNEPYTSEYPIGAPTVCL